MSILSKNQPNRGCIAFHAPSPSLLALCCTGKQTYVCFRGAVICCTEIQARVCVGGRGPLYAFINIRTTPSSRIQVHRDCVSGAVRLSTQTPMCVHL